MSYFCSPSSLPTYPCAPSVAELLTMVAKGEIDQTDLVATLLKEPMASLGDLSLLVGSVDQPTFTSIVQAQTGMIASKAAEEARVKALAERSQGVITAKISKKGAVSIYGINGNMPVTLYANQCARLFSEETIAKIETLCNSADAKADFTFADYVFAKSKEGYGAPLSADDLKYARKLASGEFKDSHSFLIGGQHDASSATALELLDMLERLSKDDKGAIANVAQKLSGIRVVVRLSRKA